MKETIKFAGRIYTFFKLGYTNYISIVLGITAYFTIIYNFLLYRYLPSSGWEAITIFIVIFSLASIAIGWVVKKSGFWGQEHQISMEANPALNYPIGEKEMLGYDSSILSYETGILMIKNQIKVNQKLGISTKELEENLNFQGEMLNRIKEMRYKGKKSS